MTSDTRRIIELEDSVHRLATDVANLPVRTGIAAPPELGYGTIKGFVKTAATAADGVVDIWDIELLHPEAPSGVTLEERTDAGTFTVRNMFLQDFDVDDIVVAFETVGSIEDTEISPGLANDDEQELANLNAEDLSNRLAFSKAKKLPGLWWGFKPEGASGARAFRTSTTIPVATWDGQILTLGKGSGKLYSTYQSTPGQWEVLTEDIDIYTMAKNEATPSDTDVQCILINGIWVIVWEECPATP